LFPLVSLAWTESHDSAFGTQSQTVLQIDDPSNSRTLGEEGLDLPCRILYLLTFGIRLQ